MAGQKASPCRGDRGFMFFLATLRATPPTLMRMMPWRMRASSAALGVNGGNAEDEDVGGGHLPAACVVGSRMATGLPSNRTSESAAPMIMGGLSGWEVQVKMNWSFFCASRVN